MRISPSALKGKASVPPSKSATHRAIICAALTKSKCKVDKALVADDTIATAAGLKALGAEFDGHFIDGTHLFEKGGKIHCGESGSTLRFLLPLACLSTRECVLDGVGRLKERPIQPMVDALNVIGGKAESTAGFLPVRTKPGLEGGECKLPGNISSQFVSGLLMALPLCGRESLICLTTPLESKPYVDLTIEVMKHFGVKVVEKERGYAITPQHYEPRDYVVEGDWSSAAFWLVAGAVGGGVTVENVKPSKQADCAIVKILEEMGARVKMRDDGVEVEASELNGVEVDVSQTPDLVPILAVAGCFAKGKTVLKNAARLRLKESDRLAALAEELKKMGALVEEGKDALVVRESALKGASVKSHGDHRIAMALSIAASYASGRTEVEDAECVSKSYPSFYRDFKSLGGKCE